MIQTETSIRSTPGCFKSSIRSSHENAGEAVRSDHECFKSSITQYDSTPVVNDPMLDFSIDTNSMYIPLF